MEKEKARKGHGPHTTLRALGHLKREGWRSERGHPFGASPPGAQVLGALALCAVGGEGEGTAPQPGSHSKEFGSGSGGGGEGGAVTPGGDPSERTAQPAGAGKGGGSLRPVASESAREAGPGRGEAAPDCQRASFRA